MEKYEKCNFVVRAWHVARTEGWYSLICKIISKGLAILHGYLPSSYNTMGDVLNWISSHTFDVYSFDIFDTLVRRKVDPELIKLLVAERLCTSLSRCGVYISPEEILLQRNKAEQTLRRKSALKGKDAECELDDIVRETLRSLTSNSALDSEEIIQEIINYEVDLEKKASEPIPGAEAVLCYLKSLGKRVICVSDTYLSVKHVAEILEYHGLLRYIDMLYVSSDVKLTKGTTKLYQYVLKNEGSKIMHIGDNYTLDYYIPRKLGIKALWFHNREEIRAKAELKKLLYSNNKMNYINAILRREAKINNELYRIGYEVLGPPLTVFVHNVAEQAREDGIETLFFVARDGFALKKIYETLRSNLDNDKDWPPSKYLCLSRFSIRLASIHQLGYNELNIHMAELRRTGITLTLRNLLTSYGLEAEEFLQMASAYGIDIDEPINESNCKSRLYKLLESDKFQEHVRLKSNEARKLLRAYLVSIGFTGKHKVALVDGQSSGLSLLALEQAFANDEEYPICYGYFFSLSNAGRDLELPRVKGIIHDWRTETRKGDIAFEIFANAFVELFTHPNHGVTVGYREVDGKVIPLFRHTAEKNEYHMIFQVLKGILCYAKYYSAYYGLHNYKCQELLEYVKSNLRQWVIFPPKKDVEVLKHIFVVNDWPEERITNLINKVTFKDMITIKEFIKKLVFSAWIPGTLRLTPMPGLNWLFYKIISCKKLGYRQLLGYKHRLQNYFNH